MSQKNNGSGLLTGIRVLDLADEKASFCSKLIADLGAQVIKIERPCGDHSRKIGPFLNDDDTEKSLSFIYNNTSKLSITLNIEDKEGKSIFLRLVEGADAVIETFPPGYLDNKELSFDQLKCINPRLILASVTDFGQTGPKHRYKSCDLVASAAGGQIHVSGSSSTPPLKIFGDQSYYSGSLFAAIGILVALRKRSQDGAGAHLDISLQESAAASLEHVLPRYFNDGIVPVRQGARHWDNAFDIFPCKDGFIHMTLFHQWDTLIEWIASEGMADDLTNEKWQDEQYRNAHVEHVIKVIGRWTKTHTVEELFEQGQLMRFPWAPVQTPMEVTQSPQLKARNFFVPVKHSNDTVGQCPGIPYKFSGADMPPQKSAPEPGEDNRSIYGKELGMSDKELKRLHERGVI
ncbi:MAG: CoA transferase [Deltaproteobacteria bacterium]|nr:CoA transferase [Deltaproteobacteria bacterium]